ncbi:MAG: hypothetical protein DHS20C05_07190 [Hyphococcus sp.]|nr:MAG: hypothetical protein DHS20C05_07190 [Marinicaulis sp.]
MATTGVISKTDDETRTYTASQARQKFADLLDEVASSGRVIVKRRKKTVAMVDAEWLEQLERRVAESEADKAERARKHLEKNGGKDLEEFEKEVGLT